MNTRNEMESAFDDARSQALNVDWFTWQIAWHSARASAATMAESCAHSIVDARNPVVKSGYLCIDCGAVFSAADHAGTQQQAEPRTPSGWRGRLQEMRDASYTYSQYPELAQAVFDSVIDALGEMEAVQKQELCDGERKAFEIALKQYAEACHRSESSSAMDAARARVCAIFYRAAQQQAEPTVVRGVRVCSISDIECTKQCGAICHHEATQQQAEPGADERIKRDAVRFADAFADGWVPFLPEDTKRTVDLLRILAARSGQRAGVAKPHLSLNDAMRDVFIERVRQQLEEGWTPAHDDAHTQMEMAEAAAVYALAAAGWTYWPYEKFWPWDASWWKPTTPRRNLVKAGALILAEIERLDRAAAPTQQQEGL